MIEESKLFNQLSDANRGSNFLQGKGRDEYYWNVLKISIMEHKILDFHQNFVNFQKIVGRCAHTTAYHIAMMESEG